MPRCSPLLLLALLGLRPALAQETLVEDGAADLFGLTAVPPQVLELLHGRSAAERRIAVDKLEALDPAVAVPLIVPRLKDSEPVVRVRAAAALGRHQALEAAAALVDTLGDSDSAVRAAAAEALGNFAALPAGLAPRAAQALGRALGDAQFPVRLAALRATQRLLAAGALGDAEAHTLIGPVSLRTEDENVGVRRAAVAALAHLPADAALRARAVPPLLSRLSDAARDVRADALAALGLLGATAAAPAALRLLPDPVEEVRRQAALCLGRLGAVAALPALSALLSDSAEGVRVAAAQALALLARRDDGPEPVQALLRCLLKDDLRPTCREAVVGLGPRVIPAVLELLRAPALPEPPEALIDLLRDVSPSGGGDARLRPQVVAALQQELTLRRAPREQVLEALTGYAGRESAPLLAGYLKDADATVRRRALLALLRAPGALDDRAADVLSQASSDSDRGVRLLAMQALGQLSPSLAAPRLTELCGRGDLEERAAAARALAGMAARAPLPEATLSALVPILSEPSGDGPAGGGARLRREAAQALGRSFPQAGAHGRVLAELIQRLRRGGDGDELHDVLAALGGALRGRPEPALRPLLLDLAEAGAEHTPQAALALSALDALAALQDAGAAPRLARLLQGEQRDGLRRTRAAYALGALVADHPNEALAPLLAALAGDSDARVRAEAAWGLSRLRPEVPAAARWQPKVVAALRQALARNRAGGDGGVGDAGERVNLAAALARLGAAEPGDAVLLGDREAGVRANGAALLGTLAPRSPGLTARLRNLAELDEDQRVRRAARAALAGTLTVGPAQAGARRHFLGLHNVDVDHRPVAEARLRLLLPDGLVRVAVTDGRGMVRDELLPAGACSVELVDDGLRAR